MPARSRGRRESKPESQVIIRPMCKADNAVLYDLVYWRILVTQCYDLLLANIQKINFHFTIGFGLVHCVQLPAIHTVCLGHWRCRVSALFVRSCSLHHTAHRCSTSPSPKISSRECTNTGARKRRGGVSSWGELSGQVVAMVAIQQVSSEVAEVERLATGQSFREDVALEPPWWNTSSTCVAINEYSRLTIDVNETSLPARVLCRQLGFHWEGDHQERGIRLLQSARV